MSKEQFEARLAWAKIDEMISFEPITTGFSAWPERIAWMLLGATFTADIFLFFFK